MTLGRFSILLTAVLVAVPIVGALGSGQPMYVKWLVLAPVPVWLAYRSAYADWTLGRFLDEVRGEDPIEAELDAALRPPVPTPGALDADDAFFVPDCPR